MLRQAEDMSILYLERNVWCQKPNAGWRPQEASRRHRADAN